MFPIVGMIFQKTQSFPLHVLHDFNDTVKRARRCARQVPIDIVTAGCQYFRSSPEQCNSAEMRLRSKMLRMRIPCGHRFAMRCREGMTGKLVLPETLGLKLKKCIGHV
jgi:hypothetical protein